MSLGRMSASFLRQPRRVLMTGVITMAAAAGAGTAAHAQQAEPLRNVVQLSASGSVEVDQDWLQMQLSAVREGSSAAVVQQQLKQVVEAALRSLQPQAQGQDMQVHSGSFGVYPRQDDQGKIKGWQGRAEVVLEGRDFARISQAAAQVQDMAVSSMGFGLSRGGRQKVLEQAQADAIGQFKQRASFLAKQFGFSGYTLREVNVNTQDGFYVPRMQRAGLVMAVAEKADMASPVPVEAGKEQVTVQVSGSIQLH